MSDFNFDKAFANDLGKERPFEPRNEGWGKVAAALETRDKRQRRRRMLLLLLLPAVIIGAFGLLGTALYRNTARIEQMQAEITRLRTGTAVFVTDTIIRHTTVIQYDTIFRTVTMQRIVPGAARVNVDRDQAGHDAQDAIPKEINPGTDADRSPALPEFQAITPETPRFAEPQHSGADSLAVAAAGQSAIPGQPESQKMGNYKALEILPFLPQHKVSVLESRHKNGPQDLGLIILPMPAETEGEKLVRRFRPHNVAVGLTSGILFPQAAHLQHFSVWSMGLNAEMSFGRHYRLRASTDYVPTRFQVEPFGQYDWNIPQLTPPTPNDTLRFITINQPLWDFSLGFRYLLRPEKRLRPFGSVAWLGELTQDQALQYEYKNQATETNTYIRMHRNESRFNPGGFLLGLGLEYSVLKRVFFQVESQYQRQVSRAPRMSGRWNAKAALMYRF